MKYVVTDRYLFTAIISSKFSTIHNTGAMDAKIASVTNPAWEQKSEMDVGLPAHQSFCDPNLIIWFRQAKIT